ncbi:MAG TPA: hypothetical protein VLD61_01740 [Methylomirabilota bacterium]|nr:hypothetical protein [Methylomirabilota bacterium]
MASTTIGFGIALILVGLGGYVGSSAPTALIPAVLGMLLAVLGILARRPAWRKHVMHGAAVVGLVGTIGGIPGVIGLLRVLGGADLARPRAAVLQTAMAVLSGAFLALCVRSFVAARRGRDAR